LNDKTLIIGSGECAAQTAELLVAANLSVIVAGKAAIFPEDLTALCSASAPDAVELLASTRLLTCNGFVGQFEVSLDVNGETTQRRVATVVIAEDCRRDVNFDSYDLKPAENIWSLSDLKKEIEENHGRAPARCEGKHVLFLNGLSEEGPPFIFEEVVRGALSLQAVSNTHTAVLSANLKVAGNGLEALYREAKKAGTLFFKFADTRPSIRQLEDGRVEATFNDETTGHRYALRPDLTVVDERPAPSEYLKHLGRQLGLHTDTLGFLQMENVHRYSVFTNRRGILVCGTARGPVAPAEIATEAAEAAAAVRVLQQGDCTTTIEKAQIDKGQCIKCLTCYRLCPYRAIQKGLKMTVAAEACEGCGICAAECPRGAIVLGDATHRKKQPEISAAPQAPLMAFCCSRSAARAKELADCSRRALPRHLHIIEMPCAGGLSCGDILAALAGGAAGVLVMTCHEGNCHSETGNILARRRIELLSEQLQQIGSLADRLEIHTLAANMATEFVEIVRRFEKKIDGRYQ
jgi:coenzyme F420-reducing hydrogenase delta subunit/Pyruvate/2-oxoacid:ferredoxin oxidoreductase delta subunit